MFTVTSLIICLIYKSPMTRFTPKEHQDSQITKLKGTTCRTPSKLTINFIMGYAAALTVLETKSLGFTKFLIN